MIGWFARRGIVYVALVVAILLYWSTKPSFESFRQLSQTASTLVEAKPGLRQLSVEAIGNSNANVATFHHLGRTEIDKRIGAARHTREVVAKACGSDLAAIVTRGADGVVENRKQCLRETLLTREIATLTAIRSSIDARRPGEPLPNAINRHRKVMSSAALIMRDASTKHRSLDEDYMPDILQRQKLSEQQARYDGARNYYDAAARNVGVLVASQRAIGRSTHAATLALTKANAEYDALVEERAKALSGNNVEKARHWAEANNIDAAMKWAAFALLTIVVSPFLIRLFCYFVLAPAAMRRPNIRLRVPGEGSGLPVLPSSPSTTSLGVQLEPGEELLVRQNYLQTTSPSGAAGTQWFLDWRHPITSFATGLTFLTRIRGDEELITVSAVHDPFAEVTSVTLPPGSSCVLHPSAIAAVAQPISNRLRVAGHWRLFSLNAWLTLQLRYLVFHGPARLIVQGGRGVRVERAEHGRIFGQRQLVGFSADLSYSVTRTETFWPYFFGREQLLKDRVEAGHGVLIIEEAPFAGRRGRDGPRGIEGFLDAGMKVFGM